MTRSELNKFLASVRVKNKNNWKKVLEDKSILIDGQDTSLYDILDLASLDYTQVFKEGSRLVAKQHIEQVLHFKKELDKYKKLFKEIFFNTENWKKLEINETSLNLLSDLYISIKKEEVVK